MIERPTLRPSVYYLPFFVSGFAALLYQVVWQRALFALFGVNIESVTVIVTAFMIGLGVGSLAGGRLSKRSRVPLLGTFGLIELCVGAFGLISLPLFRFVGSATAGAPPTAIAAVAMALLLIPTVLMGSTLPLLAAHVVRSTGNVGESVGMLYFVNTYGSAVACFAAAFVVMRTLGESGAVHLAASLNLIVGLGALLGQRLTRDPAASDADAHRHRSSEAALALSPALALAGVCGFISLAYEIVWYRLYAFASGDAARCFAALLGAYLAGIAFGSVGIRDMSRRGFLTRPRASLGLLANLIIWAGVVSFLVGPLVAAALQHHLVYQTTLPLVALGAGLMGASLPLLSHAAIAPGDDVGRRLSFLYMANIVGSAAGSLTVGFVLMNYASLQHIAVMLLVASLAVTAWLLRPGRTPGMRVAMAGLLCAATLAVCAPLLYGHLYERLLMYDEPGLPFEHVVENRSGVIAVSSNGTVYGGGVYDGKFNTDLFHDTNGIYRAFALSALPREPREVLMVGLSSGSWAQVIVNHPSVAHLTIVEINPGYLELIARYPAVASLLHNPKVTIIIDDGRRWLISHPARTFDLTVMNTSVHQRAYSTNVLSVEFLQLVKRHLNRGGVHYYNTTYSEEALHAGVSVFPYAIRIANFLAVSDSPLRLDRQVWQQRLARYTIDGAPVVRPNDASAPESLRGIWAHLDELSASPSPASDGVETGDSLRRRLARAAVITDDNMGSEWQ
ncbi:MAG TPA: fused MFS/spermidine synthase [Vicinamibacterales bacterium]|jgi:predicted membrane-bound spermidine synthase|nr:fused MFS/spermidine synthase [Vicinamibacterales bacterium]